LGFVLPYVVKEAKRKKPFTSDMEVAAILCLAEAKRKKPGILTPQPEEISFISKLHYPFWAVPWETRCVIVDGLGILSHTLTHMKVPDVEVFTEDVRRNATDRQQYRNVLKRHAQTFKNFVGEDVISIKAVVADVELLSAVHEYIKQGTVTKEEEPSSLVLYLNEDEAVERAERLIDQWKLAWSEIRGLQYAINVLNEETKLHEQKILREIEIVQERYADEIARVKPLVEKKVEQLMAKRETKIQKVVKARERKLNTLIKEKEGLERKLQRLKRNMDTYQKKKESRRRRGDKPGESYWTRMLKGCRKEASRVEKRIRTLSQRIEAINEKSDDAIRKLEEDYEELISREKRKIADLEAACNSKVKAKRKELEELQTETSSIVNQIGILIDKKRLYASKIEEATVPWELEEASLICVPFYLVRYETERKSRYQLFAHGGGGLFRHYEENSENHLEFQPRVSNQTSFKSKIESSWKIVRIFSGKNR